MANEAFNDWSPWLRALFTSPQPQPPEGMPVGPQRPAATIPGDLPGSPAPSVSEAPPLHRIEDERSAGTRGTTPQGGATGTGRTGMYQAGAISNAAAPRGPSYPLQQEIAGETAEMARMNQPTKTTLKDRLRSALTMGAAGWLGPQAVETQMTLRDRAAARQQAERVGLA